MDDGVGWFDVLALLANVGSLVGLFFTWLAYFKVRRLREHYALIGRVPVDAERLSQLASELAEQNFAGVTRRELLRTLGEMKAALESIAGNIGSEHAPSYVKLLRQIDSVLRESELDSKKLDDIYERAVHLTRRAFNVVEDRKYRLAP